MRVQKKDQDMAQAHLRPALRVRRGGRAGQRQHTARLTCTHALTCAQHNHHHACRAVPHSPIEILSSEDPEEEGGKARRGPSQRGGRPSLDSGARDAPAPRRRAAAPKRALKGARVCRPRRVCLGRTCLCGCAHVCM